MTKKMSLAHCTGRTRAFYQMLQDNLYEKNYKDAPAVRNLAAQIAMSCMALTVIYWELRWVL